MMFLCKWCVVITIVRVLFPFFVFAFCVIPFDVVLKMFRLWYCDEEEHVTSFCCVCWFLCQFFYFWFPFVCFLSCLSFCVIWLKLYEWVRWCLVFLFWLCHLLHWLLFFVTFYYWFWATVELWGNHVHIWFVLWTKPLMSRNLKMLNRINWNEV